MIRYNPQHGLSDVFAADGTLLGAVPNDREGLALGARAIAAYAAGDQTPPPARAGGPVASSPAARAARRLIVLAGGTPNAAPLRRGLESWETSVTRHQRQLKLARSLHPVETAEGA